MTEPSNLKQALEDDLSEEELKDLGTSFDMVGDIAVIKLPDSLLPKKNRVGEALMEVHGNLKSVLLQTGPVEGEFRTRDLEHIAGESETETIHKEHGCSFKVDLEKVYFSPRLANERMSIAEQVEPGETVVNMFAGVGCYSILIARHSNPEKVYSIDKNPVAVEYMRENIKMNKVSGTVVPVKGDARAVIKEYLSNEANRVLMPLPEFARDFFDVALKALSPERGIIHFYDYGEEPDIFAPSFQFAKGAVKGKKVELLDKRKVRSYAPNLYHVVLDLQVRNV